MGITEIPIPTYVVEWLSKSFFCLVIFSSYHALHKGFAQFFSHYLHCK
jgi:hypothetical protein